MSARCIICDYDLQALDPAGKCPECGTPIERSLKGDQLRYADQNWLRTVHVGMRIIMWSVLSMVLASVLFAANIAITVLVKETSFASIYDVIAGILIWFFLAIITISPWTLVVGLWLSTTSEPRDLNRDSLRPLALRGMSLLIVPVVALWFVMNSSQFQVSVSAWVQMGVAVGSFLVVVGHMTLFNDYLQALDKRCVTVDKKRNMTLQKYRKQGLGCAGIVLALTIYTIVRGLMQGRPSEPAILGIVIYIWLAVLLFSRGAARHIAMERAIAASAPAETPAQA